MSIDIKDILTLDDDNKYVVVSKVYFEGKDFLYLVDVNNNANLKFCYVDNDELVESNDKELNTKLLPLFFDEIKDMLPIE